MLFPFDNLCSQMKPLFSKAEKEVLLPGDPRREAFEEQWRLAGGKPEEMEGQTIEIDNEDVRKVSLFTKFYMHP